MTALTQKASGRAALTAGIIGAVVLLLALVLVSTASAVVAEEVRVRADQACASEGYGDTGEQFIIPRSNLSVYEETITLDSGVTVDLFSPPNRSFVDFTVTGALVEGGFIFNRVNSNQANFYDYRPGGTDKGLLEPPPRDNGNDKLVVLCFGVRAEVSIDKVTQFGTGFGSEADSTNDYIVTGEDIRWEYRVSIPGAAPAESLTINSVSDDQGETPVYVSGDTDNDDELDLGETWIYRATGTAGEGAYSNLGSVSAVGVNTGRSTSDSDGSAYFGANAVIDIVKTTSGYLITPAEPDPSVSYGPENPYTGPDDDVFIVTGDGVLWTYVVSNDGNVPLSGVTVADDGGDGDGGDTVNPGYVSGDVNEDGMLDPTEEWTYQALGVAEYSTIGGGYTNVATASATAPDGAGTVEDATDTSGYFGYAASFDVTVTLLFNGEEYDPSGPFPVILSGDPITWRFSVTNTGNVPVSTTIVAELGGETPVTVCSLGDIPPGDVEGENPATCDYDTTSGDGETTTSFQVVGQDPNGNEVSETIEDVGYYGGLNCGDSVRYEGPDLVGDGPDVGFYVGPVSSDQPCGTAVEITASIDDDTQSTSIEAPAGYPFIGTGVATIIWDAVPRDDAPLVRTVQGIGGVGPVIEYCAAVVDVTQPSPGADFVLTDPAALYPTATDFNGDETPDGDVCLIRQFNDTVDIGSGVVYTQLIEVFYIWNDPSFSRPR